MMLNDEECSFAVIDHAGAWTFDPRGLAGVRRDLVTGLGRQRSDRRSPHVFGSRLGGHSTELVDGSPPSGGAAPSANKEHDWELIRPVFVDLARGGLVTTLAGPVRLSDDDLNQLVALATSGDPGDPVRSEQFRSLGLARPIASEISRPERARAVLDKPADVLQADRPVLGVVHAAMAPGGILPLALGQMTALINSERSIDGSVGLKEYGYRAALIEFDSVDDAVALAERRPGATWMLSCYTWSTRANLRYASAIRSADSTALIILGGPDIPGTGIPLQVFAAEHDYVDFIVHGEGAATLNELLLRRAAGSLAPDEPIDGATRVIGGTAVSGGQRARIDVLDALPSPYLDGTFEALIGPRFPHALVETNRGCPFGCSFCDWGGATLSRIRSFSLERVFAEIDWLTASGVETLGLTDANFGILPRDTEIADYIGSRRESTGRPTGFLTNYAKNPRRNVVDIVDRLKSVGLVTSGRVSLQTVDDDVLEAVDRTNIKTSRYVELISAFRRRGLPIVTDMMFGLPGSSHESFQRDAEFLMGADVHASFARTRSLPNAPMAAPAYQERFSLRLDSVGNVAEASTFDQQDLREILRDWSAYFVADSLGILRIVLRFWRHETQRTEWSLLSQLLESIRSDGAYPTLSWALGAMTRWTVPLPSWEPLRNELDAACADLIGSRPRGWESVLAAQAAHWPDPTFSEVRTIDLDHDVAQWWRDIDDARIVETDWVTSVTRVGARGPGTVTVSDPAGVCAVPAGPWVHRAIPGVWELDSPLARSGWAQSIIGGIE